MRILLLGSCYEDFFKILGVGSCYEDIVRRILFVGFLYENYVIRIWVEDIIIRILFR